MTSRQLLTRRPVAVTVTALARPMLRGYAMELETDTKLLLKRNHFF